MTNLKKVLSIVVIAVLLTTVATMVFATNDGFVIINDTNVGENNTTGLDNNTTNLNNTTLVDNNTTNPINSITGTNNTSTYNTTNNTVSNLPKTGAGDYTMVLTIAGLAIIAIYAYKKVSDYKNI